MEDLCFLLFFLGLYWFYKWCNKEEEQAKKDAYFRATYKPSYTSYQAKSPDTIEVPKIEGEYDGSFNKEFEK